MRPRSLSVVTLVSSLVIAALGQAPAVSVSPARCDFGVVRAGDPVTCTFTLHNSSVNPQRVTGASLTPPLRLGRTPASIASGGEITLSVELPTGGIRGEYAGRVTVELSGAAPLTLPVTGVVRQPVSFVPGPVFYLAGHSGETASQSIEVVNNESQPLTLALASTPPEGMTLTIDPVEAGRRYRVTLHLLEQGPIGERTDTFMLSTGLEVRPTLSLRAQTRRRPRVYTFPDSVDLGAIRLQELKADPSRFAQILMIYQRGGRGFEVTVRSTNPAIRVMLARGPLGDRYQATVAYAPDAIAVGTTRAILTFDTNDPQFPRLDVSVRGEVLPDQ